MGDATLPVRGADALVLRELSAGTVRVTTTTWAADESLAVSDWLACGARLGSVGRAIGWWLGDWLRFGNRRYGERYPRAARVTGYDVSTLRNMVYVASQFEPQRRRSTLSWSHHADVAAFSERDQERWLSLAERNRLSVQCLRMELRADRRRLDRGADVASQVSSEVAAPRPRPRSVVCPECRHVIDLSGGEAPD
jgi:hypothetical protein